MLKDILKKDKIESLKDVPYKKNPLVYEFETKTPKDIRDCAVKQVVDAYKTAIINLTNGNIRFFNIANKKKTAPRQTLEITKKLIKMK